MREPVAIVAAGAVTPIGRDIDTFWSSLLTGVSGISTIERFPVSDLRVQRGGEIKKLPPPRGAPLRTECRASRLLASAADDLRMAAGAILEADPARIAVVVGTALGGVEEGERALAAVQGRPAGRSAPRPSPAPAASPGPTPPTRRCWRPSAPTSTTSAAPTTSTASTSARRPRRA